MRGVGFELLLAAAVYLVEGVVATALWCSLWRVRPRLRHVLAGPWLLGRMMFGAVPEPVRRARLLPGSGQRSGPGVAPGLAADLAADLAAVGADLAVAVERVAAEIGSPASRAAALRAATGGGLLPDPQTLLELEALSPGAAERVMSEAERVAAERHARELAEAAARLRRARAARLTVESRRRGRDR